jgi:hypothetical protein
MEVVSIIIYFSAKMKEVLSGHLASICTYVYPPKQLSKATSMVYKTRFVYLNTLAHLSGIIFKPF